MLSKHGRYYHSSRLLYPQFHFLLSAVKGISSLNPRERRMIRIEFLTLQGKPSTYARKIQRPIPSNRLPFIPGRGSGPQATVGPYAHQLCRTYVCSATTKPVFLSAKYNVLPHVGAWENQKTSGGRYVHLPGRLVTRLTAYHISRHVTSTFKSLATTTTRCDLNQF
jgi:hypothetical protein